MQACRGTEGQTGEVNDSPFYPRPQQPTATSVRYADRGSLLIQTKGLCLIIQTFCWLIQMSITVSYRNELDGSRFVCCLVEVFREKAGHGDVLSMLIMVNDKLSKMGDIGKSKLDSQ